MFQKKAEYSFLEVIIGGSLDLAMKTLLTNPAVLKVSEIFQEQLCTFNWEKLLGVHFERGLMANKNRKNVIGVSPQQMLFVDIMIIILHNSLINKN